jgi:glycosyltransferase involved in cell wall biosynthesis
VTTSLLVLTKHFPYNMGETAAESYLETEVAYLAEAFDEVLVAATEAPADRSPVQVLPVNARSVSLGFVQSKAEKARCLLNGSTRRSGPETLRGGAIRSERGLRPVEATWQRYFVGKAARKWDRLTTELDAANFVPTHTYSFWLYDTALMAAWAKQLYSCSRAVARAHGYDLYRDRTRSHYLPCREYLLGTLDAVLPCSIDGTAYLSSEWPAYADKVSTSYLGTRELPDRSEEPKGDLFEVVTCSRAVPVKRLGLVCDAMALLDSDGLPIHWTHYGDGPDLAQVRKRARAFRSVESSFPGNIVNHDLLRRYGETHIDLFVNASSSEGLPISIMEASGFGVPVLATDVGGTREIVEDGVNGRLMLEEVDARGLAAAIREFWEMSPDELAGHRRAARHVWAERFRTEKNVHVLLNALLDKR